MFPLILAIVTAQAKAQARNISVSDVRNKSARISLWTDVGLGFGGPKDWEDIDYKLSYLMDTYDIVSLEKCLFEGNNDQNTVSLPPSINTLAPPPAQEGHFLDVTNRMHKLSPESETKILYYWHFTAVRCYQSVQR